MCVCGADSFGFGVEDGEFSAADKEAFAPLCSKIPNGIFISLSLFVFFVLFSKWVQISLCFSMVFFLSLSVL